MRPASVAHIVRHPSARGCVGQNSPGQIYVGHASADRGISSEGDFYRDGVPVVRLAISLYGEAAARKRACLQDGLDNPEQPICVGTIHKEDAGAAAEFLSIEFTDAIGVDGSRK